MKNIYHPDFLVGRLESYQFQLQEPSRFFFKKRLSFLFSPNLFCIFAPLPQGLYCFLSNRCNLCKKLPNHRKKCSLRGLV